MASHSSILAWRIPWTEKPGGLQSVGSQTVGHNWSDLACVHYLKTLNLVWFYFFVFLFGIFFSSSCEIVCLLLKHQKYCVVCLEAVFHSSYTHSAHARLQAACFLHQHVHFRRDPDTHPPVSPWEPGQAVRCCMWIISQENEKIFLKKKGNWPNIYNC